jgi:hypothetical protein
MGVDVEEQENSKVQALALDKQLESDCVVSKTKGFHLFDQQVISLSCQSTL